MAILSDDVTSIRPHASEASQAEHEKSARGCHSIGSLGQVELVRDSEVHPQQSYVEDVAAGSVDTPSAMSGVASSGVPPVQARIVPASEGVTSQSATSLDEHVGNWQTWAAHVSQLLSTFSNELVSLGARVEQLDNNLDCLKFGANSLPPIDEDEPFGEAAKVDRSMLETIQDECRQQISELSSRLDSCERSLKFSHGSMPSCKIKQGSGLVTPEATTFEKSFLDTEERSSQTEPPTTSYMKGDSNFSDSDLSELLAKAQQRNASGRMTSLDGDFPETCFDARACIDKLAHVSEAALKLDPFPRSRQSYDSSVPPGLRNSDRDCVQDIQCGNGGFSSSLPDPCMGVAYIDCLRKHWNHLKQARQTGCDASEQCGSLSQYRHIRDDST
jgi:hypothetical protein